MTTFTGCPTTVVSFDCDGTLTNQGEVPIGQDSGQVWDLRLLNMCLDAGWRVGVMTCNVVTHVTRQLSLHGVTAYPDVQGEYKIPPAVHPLITGLSRYVLVTNRKLLADWYLDDHNIEFKFGDPLPPVITRMGLPVPALGRFVPSGWMPDDRT